MKKLMSRFHISNSCGYNFRQKVTKKIRTIPIV